MSSGAAALPRPDATLKQRSAADPTASVWVAASAGSGKTTVLTNRVLSLLLDGTLPERILCLTFTKAAAAEMANRVHEHLGKWAVADDGELSEELTALINAQPDDETLAHARRLFARVLDVPGGLKIQTVHGFCQSLLGRFPLEAGIAPHFEVIDERTAAELLDTARDRVLARAGGDTALAEALDAVVLHVDEQRFHEVMGALAHDRHRLNRLILGRGIDAVIAESWKLLSLERAETEESILAAACADSAFDGKALKQAARALLDGGGKSDKARGQAIADWLAAGKGDRGRGFDAYAAAFLTNDGDIRARLATKGVAAEFPEILDILAAEGARLQAVGGRRAALVTALATTGMLRLGAALIDAYDEAKGAIAKLDYDDLILKTRALLKQPGIAPWVLFKLDGGLDHILIDEAQDTSPEQWEVIATLAEEFFAGKGAREQTRTIFAVGDPKQSIYSFQRADPEEFRRMREHFAERVENAAGTWRAVGLDVSYRSTSAVLSAVDAVFTGEDAADGVLEDGETIHHRAWRTGQAGLVELWPLVGPRDDGGGDEDEVWVAPLERQAGDDPSGRLARVVAARIKGWIGNEVLEARGRTVRAGDIMVLLRKRSPFIEPLVRALKEKQVPVSGVDRMVLTEQISVMDLVALGRFLLLPGDDLTLATVLKGPLAGFDDDDLFRLAWDRRGASLWQRLRDESAQEPRFEAARAWLAGLMARVDFLRPYELFAEVLTQPACGGESGRRRMLARLGPDADDPIDEFLNLALGYERGRAASLEGFLHWLEAGEAQVKRDLEQSGRNEVRVMTVHGAKGLQAPIVILPDTTSKPRGGPVLLWSGDAVLWPPRRACEEEIAGALRTQANNRRDQEYNRLLYVAMTRAEDRLYVCGAHGARGPTGGCWYDLVRDGLDGLAVEADFSFDQPDGWSGKGLRLEGPQEAKPEDREADAPAIAVAGEAEDWMLRPPPREPEPPRPLAPSRPEMPEPPVESPLGADRGRRFQRGLLIHRLLQTLPELQPEERFQAARRFLERAVHGLDRELQAEIAAEVMTVLDDPVFHPLFGPGSRAEVPVVGRIAGPAGEPGGGQVVSGQIDRLVVREDSVLILDFKTNRPPPRTVEDVPGVYWRQMAAYRAVIGGIFPDRPVRCALLWTNGPNLMELDGPRLDPAGSAP